MPPRKKRNVDEKDFKDVEIPKPKRKSSKPQESGIIEYASPFIQGVNDLANLPRALLESELIKRRYYPPMVKKLPDKYLVTLLRESTKIYERGIATKKTTEITTEVEGAVDVKTKEEYVVEKSDKPIFSKSVDEHLAENLEINAKLLEEHKTEEKNFISQKRKTSQGKTVTIVKTEEKVIEQEPMALISSSVPSFENGDVMLNNNVSSRLNQLLLNMSIPQHQINALPDDIKDSMNFDFRMGIGITTIISRYFPPVTK